MLCLLLGWKIWLWPRGLAEIASLLLAFRQLWSLQGPPPGKQEEYVLPEAANFKKGKGMPCIDLGSVPKSLRQEILSFPGLGKEKGSIPVSVSPKSLRGQAVFGFLYMDVYSVRHMITFCWINRVLNYHLLENITYILFWFLIWEATVLTPLELKVLTNYFLSLIFYWSKIAS